MNSKFNSNLNSYFKKLNWYYPSDWLIFSAIERWYKDIIFYIQTNFKIVLLKIFWLIIFQFIFIQSICASEKIALIMGNANYKYIPRLENPINDALDLATELKKIGFEVSLILDSNIINSKKEINKFSELSNNTKIILFYYAGHGVQINGENYIIPPNFSNNSETNIISSSLNVSDIIRQMQGSSKASLVVILDACRDNPFPKEELIESNHGSARSIQRGLAPIEIQKNSNTSGKNMMIVFSTSPNSSALDGDGRNSPFAKALIRHITTPSLDLGLVMRRVTAEVERETKGYQSPWVNTSLDSEIILAPLSEQKCFIISGKEYCR